MATFSYTTNALEDAGVAYVLSIENTRRAVQTPPLPPLTAPQYITSIFQALLASYIQQRGVQDIEDVKSVFNRATPAEQAAMKAAALAAGPK